MSDSTELARILSRHRHLTTEQQADRVLDELGWKRQHTTIDVYERDGMSLSTVKGRPHTRWVTEWIELD